MRIDCQLVFAVLASLLVAYAVSACKPKVETTPTITIQSITPPNETPILIGEKFTLTVSGLVHHAQENSYVALIVQSGSGQAVAISLPVTIKNGEKFSISVPVQVPSGSVMNANLALYRDVSSDSIAVDWRNYKIVGTKR